MKKILLCLIAGISPLLLIQATSAEEKAAPEVEKPAAANKPSLTYYYFDGWPKCNKIKVIVNDLKKTQGEKIIIKNASVTSEGAAEEIKKAKVKGHGIIAKDKKGKLVQIINGHNYGKKEIDALVAKLLP